MNRYFQFLLILCLPLISFTQENFNGVIYDVGTRLPLEQVRVQSSNPEQYSISNASGFFNISLNTENDCFPESLQIDNNIIYWSLNQNVSFELLSANGAFLYKKEGSPSGQFELPAQPSGYYFLLFESGQQESYVMLFSDGEDYSLVKKDIPASYFPLIDSILFFSKTGYFDRSSSTSNPDEFAHFNMLKTEYDSLDYFNELLRHEAFVMLHSSPANVHFSDIQSIKVLYDFEADEIYYVNINKYPSHYSFANAFLNYTGTGSSFFYTQYGTHPTRYLNLVTINYHLNIDKYVFQFASTDLIECGGIRETYDKLIATSFFGDKLYFKATNSRWNDCTLVPTITSEELYLGQNYQALNLEENFGYLRKIDIDTLASTYIGRHDVVLLNTVPNDISVVSGIITTDFQTALSHINILSHNRKTPNMALRDGWTNPRLDTLIGKLVYLSVEADSFIIRKASIEEAEAFWIANAPQTPVFLELDTITSGIFDLELGDISSVSSIGGKAANFSEMVGLGSIPLPENYFAIPFYYYQQHITENGIHTFIDQMLVDNQFSTDLVYRQQKLNELKELIIDAPLDPELYALILNEIDDFNEFESFRFRSSTNAEDLEGFSGAGLYDSYSAKKNHNTKTIDNAVKKVWASLWNIRAFDERDYFMIDQHSIAMGILVHRSFPDEDANGVVLTKNIYDLSNHGYTVNVQFKEFSIVDPEPGILHDELLIHTVNLEGVGYTLEYLTHSNIPELNGQTVLTDTELYELAEYCTEIKQHYFNNIATQNPTYLSFAVDIEFKVDSDVENRKLYIKQARIYNAN